MNPPAEYVEMIEKFMEMNVRAVKLEGASREDAACFAMVAYLKGLPVEVRSLKKKVVIFERSDWYAQKD